MLLLLLFSSRWEGSAVRAAAAAWEGVTVPVAVGTGLYVAVGVSRVDEGLQSACDGAGEMWERFNRWSVVAWVW